MEKEEAGKTNKLKMMQLLSKPKKNKIKKREAVIKEVAAVVKRINSVVNLQASKLNDFIHK